MKPYDPLMNEVDAKDLVSTPTWKLAWQMWDTKTAIVAWFTFVVEIAFNVFKVATGPIYLPFLFYSDAVSLKQEAQRRLDQEKWDAKMQAVRNSMAPSSKPNKPKKGEFGSDKF